MLVQYLGSSVLLLFFRANVIIDNVKEVERARSRLSIGIWTVLSLALSDSLKAT